MRFSPETSFKFQGFAILSSSPFWARFWSLLASLWGAFWPPRWLKPVLKFFQDPPRADPYTFFSAPRASKSGPRGLQEAKGCLNRFLTPPSGLQDRFWSDLGAILEPFWTHVGVIFELCWSFLSSQKISSKAEQSIAEALQEHCRSIAGALQKHCRSIAEHCCCIAGALQQHCSSIAEALQEHCRSIAGALQTALSVPVLPRSNTPWARGPANFIDDLN